MEKGFEVIKYVDSIFPLLAFLALVFGLAFFAWVKMKHDKKDVNNYGNYNEINGDNNSISYGGDDDDGKDSK